MLILASALLRGDGIQIHTVGKTESPLRDVECAYFPPRYYFVLLQIYKIILSDGNALPIFLQEIAYPKAKGHVYEV